MDENRNPSQSDMIYAYMQQHGSITPLEALRELGCMRLGARIWELKHDRGIDIITGEETAKNSLGKPVRYARYALNEQDKN